MIINQDKICIQIPFQIEGLLNAHAKINNRTKEEEVISRVIESFQNENGFSASWRLRTWLSKREKLSRELSSSSSALTIIENEICHES